MVRKRYTEEQIIAVLNEAESGARTADLCCKYGMSEAAFHNWEAKYAGLTVSEFKRLQSLGSSASIMQGRSLRAGGRTTMTSAPTAR